MSYEQIKEQIKTSWDFASRALPGVLSLIAFIGIFFFFFRPERALEALLASLFMFGGCWLMLFIGGIIGVPTDGY